MGPTLPSKYNTIQGRNVIKTSHKTYIKAPIGRLQSPFTFNHVYFKYQQLHIIENYIKLYGNIFEFLPC